MTFHDKFVFYWLVSVRLAAQSATGCSLIEINKQLQGFSGIEKRYIYIYI